MLVATEAFASAARALATFKGQPELPIVVIPHPFTTLAEDKVVAIAEASKGEIVGRIVAPADA